ncbi:MAG: homoserine kinase [Acidimicrobiia bacterium]
MTTASAPASSANLGPGFDVLALALNLRCTVSAESADEWSVLSGDEPASQATVEMVRSVAGDAGPHSVRIDSEIPVGRGLGSSAAVLVATAAAISGEADRDDLFEVAAAVEGHPDNVAAAVFGGLVAVGADGSVNRLAVHPSLQVVVAVPDEVLSTAEARAVLPAEVSRQVAVRSAARLAMLIEGLRTADSVSLLAALGDEMHEAPRRSITETPARLIAAALDAGAAYASWSGAGPSVLGFVVEDSIDPVTAALEDALEGAGSVLELAIDQEGARIE